MSWACSTRRQYCDQCRRVTVHGVTIYDDDNREIIHCTECGR